MTITVVGAGVIGCAVAHALAARGARVHVVDARLPGRGATQASAGILSPYIEAHDDTLLPLCVRSFEEYDAFLDRLRADSRCAIPYARTGTLQVAHDASGAASLTALARDLHARGVAHALLTPGDAACLEPALAGGVTAGLLVHRHGYVGARALTAALVQAARMRGAAFTRTRVLALEPADHHLRVVTETGVLQCDAAVVAAGSWSGRLTAPAGAPPPVTPVRGQLLQLRAAQPLFSRVIWGEGCYLVPWPDGTVLAGATVEDAGFDERSTAGAVATLLGAATALVPALRSAAFERARVGLRPGTADGWPIIGPSSHLPRVFYATGHFRTGVLLAPLTARLVADLVLDAREAPELAPVLPARLGL